MPAGRGKGGTSPPGNVVVFCALAVTVKTCVLRATTKKRVSTFIRKKCTPGKNPAGAHAYTVVVVVVVVVAVVVVVVVERTD